MSGEKRRSAPPDGAPPGLLREATRLVEAELRPGGACSTSPEALDGLRALRDASLRASDDDVRAELAHLQALSPKVGGCKAALATLRQGVEALRCRQRAASSEGLPRGAKETLMTGSPEAAARAMTAAAAQVSSDAREALLRCVEKQPLAPEAQRRVGEVVAKHHRTHGGKALTAATRSALARACDGTAQQEVVRRVLKGLPDEEDLRVLEASLGSSPHDVRCAARLRAAGRELREESCRGVFRDALKLAPSEPATTDELVRLLDLRVRKERLRGTSATWNGHPLLAGCLEKVGGHVALKLLRDASGGVARARADANRRDWGARLASAVASTEAAAEESCSKAIARRTDGQDALARLLAATEPAELQAAWKELQGQLRDGELQAARSQGSALRADDYRRCRQAAKEAYDARVNNYCIPKATERLSVTGTEPEMREKIVLSGEADLHSCAEAIAPHVAHWRRWRKQLLARAAATPPEATEAERRKRSVCDALEKLQAAPTSPAAAVPLLALCALPPWRASFQSWLDRHDRWGLPRNGAAVRRAAPREGLLALKLKLTPLLEDPSLLPVLAKRPCVPGPDEIHGNAWYELTMTVFGDATVAEARALASEMKAAQEAILKAAVRAAEDALKTSAELKRKAWWQLKDGEVMDSQWSGAYNPATTLVSESVYQRMWEAWLRHAAGHVDGAVSRASARIPFPPGTAQEVLEFLRVETLFFLVLFDSYGRLQETPTVERLPSWTNLRNGLGLWPAPQDPKRLAQAASVALKQADDLLNKHPLPDEDVKLYYDGSARAKAWAVWKSNLEQGHHQYVLPAPRCYPLVPFA